ncbi:Pitrilysin [Balamuthia mandrillaris]
MVANRSSSKRTTASWPAFLFLLAFSCCCLLRLSLVVEANATRASFPVMPTKSELDERSYRIIQLEKNGLIAILVSDPETEVSAAAMDVHVGHFSDPVDLPGLAHFLEHMLFLGTEKYPDEDGFGAFLASHGGSSNAYTANEHTNYFFNVDKDHLHEALDRFSAFFLGPLLSPNSTDREMNAVNSEHEKNLLNDEWRLDMVLRSTANPVHPFSYFGTGSLQTLKEGPKQKGIDVVKELHAFHKKYYSANLMRFAVIGQESLDQLEVWVRALFKDLRNINTPLPKFTGTPFRPEDLKLELAIVPVTNMKRMEMFFPMPALMSRYKEAPSAYISHLLGYEGAGSPLALLKEKGWADQLSAGMGESGMDYSLFAVSISLTEEGLEHVHDIVKIIFQYIQLIEAEGVKSTTFDEMKQLAEMEFSFKNKENPYNLVSSLADRLQEFELEDCLKAGVPQHFNSTIIHELLLLLKPHNMRLHITSKKFEGKTDQEEKWYGTAYKVTPIPASTLQEWVEPGTPDKSLFLPQPNPFIPENLSMLSQKSNGYPFQLYNSEMITAWHKHETKFKQPKADMRFLFKTPVVSETPESFIMSQIFLSMVHYQAKNFSYDANLAGIDFSLGTIHQGLKLTVQGYSDKLNVFLDKLLAIFSTQQFESKREQFDMIYEITLSDYQDLMYQAPYRSAISLFYSLLHDPSYTTEEIIAAFPKERDSDAKNRFFQEFSERFVPSLFRRMKVECLVNGNIKSSNFLQDIIHDAIENKWFRGSKPVSPSQARTLGTQRVVKLHPGKHYLFQEKVKFNEEQNSVVLNYYQTDIFSLPAFFQDSTHHSSGERSENTTSTFLLEEEKRVPSSQNIPTKFNNPYVRHSLYVELLETILGQKAFDQLRTKEQLGYIVWAFQLPIKLFVGGFAILIQSDVKDPHHLDLRVESFLQEVWKPELLSRNFQQTSFNEYVAALESLKKEESKPRTLAEQTNAYFAEIESQLYVFDRVQKQLKQFSNLDVEEFVDFCERYLFSGVARKKLSVQISGAQYKKPSSGDEEKGYITDPHRFRAHQQLYPVSMNDYFMYAGTPECPSYKEAEQEVIAEQRTLVSHVLLVFLTAVVILLVLMFAGVWITYAVMRKRSKLRDRKRSTWTPLTTLTNDSIEGEEEEDEEEELRAH